MIKSLTKSSGVVFVIILAVIPIFLWLSMSPLYVRFLSPSTTFRSLGQITGLLGMVLLSINFILAARFRFLDKIFNGLNRVYIKHHIIGALAFCLLLFHPVFLIIQYLFISLKASFLFAFSVDNWALNFGKLGLLIFIILIVFTFYSNFKYQIWKNTHKFLGIVLLLGSLHMFFIPSDVSNNLVLRYYMLAIAAVGAYSYVHRTILGIYKKGEYRYKLEKVIRMNDDVAELIFSPVSRKIKYLPGQFVYLRFEDKGILSESHPFSITSSNFEHNLSLGIKTVGDYTSMVYLLKPGRTCLIEGPFGVFSYLKTGARRQIWIAGGIGITPFLGMARQFDASKFSKDYKIDLYYSVKNSAEAAFLDEFTEISRKNDNFKFHPHFSSGSGHLSASIIVRNSKDISNADIFLCGPTSFMQTLKNQFLKLGFINKKIHSEEFNL